MEQETRPKLREEPVLVSGRSLRPDARPLSREFSLYLDMVRFLAAAFVVLYHANLERTIVARPLAFLHCGHQLVIVFFVLSGFVIAYVTDQKETTLREYWASRLSRFYSVVVPALLLTIILDGAGELASPAFYATKTSHDLWFVRLPASLLFLNEVWGFSISPWSNTPYWSLSYEMWFYALFSIGFFLRGRTRTLLLLAVCVLVGPKILLLAPVWWLGVALYRWRGPDRWPEWTGWVCVAGSIALAWAMAHYEVLGVLSNRVQDSIGPVLHRKLGWSDLFPGDYLLGGVVFLNFLGMRRVAHRLRVPFSLMASPIRALAGYTFSIYVFHLPLLFFWSVVIPGSPERFGYYVAVLGATSASIWLAGSVTEQRRLPLRRLMLEWLERLESSPLARLLARQSAGENVAVRNVEPEREEMVVCLVAETAGSQMSAGGLAQTASALSPGQSTPSRLV